MYNFYSQEICVLILPITKVWIFVYCNKLNKLLQTSKIKAVLFEMIFNFYSGRLVCGIEKSTWLWTWISA